LVADTDPIDNSRAMLGGILIIGLSAAATVMAIGLHSLVSAIRQRMSEMRRTALAIAGGDLTRRLHETGRDDEFDREAQGFNAMLDRIAALMANLKHVSDDVAHDLRTPLVRLRNRLVTVTRSAAGSAAGEDAERALEACDEMLDLFTAILRLSEIESGARRAGFVPVRLDEIVDAAIETFAPMIEDGGRTLVRGKVFAVELSGDPALLRQMLANAIENASRHTPVGTVITVSMREAEAGVVLTIADNGPGIAVADRALSLRRFGRLDTSRTLAGHGLGLTLIDAIAHLHDGHVALGDAKPGLEVAIHVPTSYKVETAGG